MQGFTTVDEVVAGPFYHGPRQMFPLVGDGDFTISFEIAKRSAAEASPIVSLGVLYFTNGVQGSFVPVVLNNVSVSHTAAQEYSAAIELGVGANQVPASATDVILMSRSSSNNLDIYSTFGPLSPTARASILRSDQLNVTAREAISVIVEEQTAELALAAASRQTISIAGANLTSAFTDYSVLTSSRLGDVEATSLQNTTTLATNETAFSQSLTNITANFDGHTADIAQSSIAIASLEGYAAANHTIQVGANGAISQIALRAASNGAVTTSDIKLSADKIIFETDGEVIWFSDASGLTMNKAIRFVGGGTPSNPDSMKVLGLAFGAASDLLEWFGPYSASIDGCTPLNGRRALDINGDSYLNGVIEGAGAVTASNTTSTSVSELSGIGSNGNMIQATSSYTATSNRNYQQSTQATSGSFTSGSLDIRLRYGNGSSAWTNVDGPAVTGTLTRSSFYDAEIGAWRVQEQWVVSMTIQLQLQGSSAINNYKWRADRLSISVPSGFTTVNHNNTISIFEPGN